MEKLTDEYLLSVIKEYYETNNKIPRLTDLPHFSLINKRFGLNNALKLLGITPVNIRNSFVSITLICPQCSIEFIRNKNRANRNKSKLLFCSLSCGSKYTFVQPPPKHKRTIEEILNEPWEITSWETKRIIVLYEQNNCCAHCGLSEWSNNKGNNQIIPLQVNHIDGDHTNNNRDNLEALCPNCHSNTETWGNSKGMLVISDEEYKEALRTSKNIHQALISLGLRPKGNSYDRARKLLAEIEKEK